jgi:2-succinyl-5-enolpyruvyl-6-hydroxy-3-cyclohexene-1-carboxylate synthase
VQEEERLGHACIMPATTDTHLLLRAFVDELVRCGIREACTSPGSRSSPIVFALVREPRLRCFSHVDERCSGFFALGVAKAAVRPVAVTCTSGTAAANLAPAVVEAFEARVPLVVLTADRPPELRGIGAGQTIDQIKLYSAAKWFFEVGTHAATPARVRWMRMLACRAVWTALEGRPGPVHLNFALREPLSPPAELPPDPQPGRSRGRPWLLRSTPGEDDAGAGRALAVVARDAHRPIVVAGRAEPGLDAVAAACERLAWPLLADPLSGARRGAAAIAHYDALLRDEAFAAARRPDLVVRCGDLPTSKPLRAWLDGLGDDAAQLALDPHTGWQDPSADLHAVLAASAAAALAAAAEHAPTADPAWLAAWHRADAAAAEAIDATLGDELSEPLVARELGALLPAAATLFVASSMPVRDVENFVAARADPPRVLCNRGANGIDGTVSSAFGAAAVSAGPVVLLVGDVALAHDIGGLLAARRLGLALTIVVLHNDGGGIFEFLPLAGSARDVFEEHVATPHGLEFEHAAALYGCAYARVHDRRALRAQLRAALTGGGTTIVEVRTDRAANLALHRELSGAVAARLAGRA